MRRVFAGLAYAALIVSFAYGAYVWGWYRGLSYHSVVASMNEARASLSAAQSLRARDTQLALELLENDIAWWDHSLRIADVPLEHRANYEIVRRRLQDYRERYGASASH